MRSIVINGIFVTVNQDNEIITDGSMIFEDDVITFIGESPEDLSKFDQVIDARGNIVMPGLINTHGHGAMSLLRGYGDDLPLQEWLEKKMWPIEGRFTKEHVKWGTLLAILEMLKTGTTTYSDFYIHMDVVADVIEGVGIRANLSRGIIGIGASSEEKQLKLSEAENFAKNWNNKADGRITTMMSPHALYTCSPNFISKIVESATMIQVPIQIHLSETAFEVEQNLKQYGVTPVKHLQQLGVFEHPTLIAHAVHVTEEEIEIIKNYQVNVSHNPGSNLKLGSGIAPIPKMLDQGIYVSLGTDSAASNNNLDLFEEMRLAALIHKGYGQDPLAIPADIAIKMATIYGAHSLFIGHYTGSLEVGKKADFIIVDVNQPHFHPMYNPITHLVYSAAGKDVVDVFVNGKQLVKKGQVQTIDEERVIYEVKRLANEWA
ncbi:N-ethylammeline chlorohydrolase [Vulcanibacillus modesticaldus]|uniref:5-methylthioadenosine/S-adenosylhomocysteine deaminase n=1 Tax=Vulcanibacillus modesticaldus TaxID=337097 RepID=A0A1D2YTN0_9BACI|nr:amidohydrolase [Vulcanibacillus modesticaldus]OEF99062.1 N-ethylammeline chlorohydrolase [Vulcanibacillus modesticaldus]